MSLVLVPSKFTMLIVFPLIMESAPIDILVLLSSSNRSLILSKLLKYAILRTWCV